MNGEAYRKPANSNERFDVNTALAEIGLIRQKIMTGGRADSEPTELNQLIIDVRNSKVTPEDGVLRARQIELARQEDH